MKSLEWLLILLGLIIIAWLIRRTLRRVRELDGRIREYHREQDAQQKLREQGLVGPPDPWTELARLYQEREEEEKKRKQE